MNTNATPTFQVQKLDALRMPLHGRQVIEASAGTGKTWTLMGSDYAGG